MAMREVLDEIERWQAAGKRVALATVVSVTGSAPRETGAVLAVNEDSEIAGSVSGGCVEPAVIEEGLRAIRDGTPKLLQFGISEEENVERIGLSCGGEIRVFVERMEGMQPLLEALRAERPLARAVVIAASQPGLVGQQMFFGEQGEPLGSFGEPRLDARAGDDAREALRSGAAATTTYRDEAEQVEVFIAPYPAPRHLIIVGAGHISQPLASIAKVLGYRVTVVDARAAFNTAERLPDADALLVEWPDEALERLPLTSATAVAVLTHDDKFDVPALATALRSSSVGYVGAIGSRGTRERRNQRLREAGVTEEQIARIHGPIGLDIGARNPAEIALAIMAQIVAARNGRLS
jgi:xanthine dehydrogenase accessory factor